MFFSLLVVLVGLTVWQKRTLCSSVLQTRRKLVKPFENILARIFRITLINTRSTFREIFARVLLSLPISLNLESRRAGKLHSLFFRILAFLYVCVCFCVCVYVCAPCAFHCTSFCFLQNSNCDASPAARKVCAKLASNLPRSIVGQASMCLCVCVCVSV